MIFLLPLLVLIAVIFGIDYIYFSDKNEQKLEQNSSLERKNPSLEREKQEYIKNLFKQK